MWILYVSLGPGMSQSGATGWCKLPDWDICVMSPLLKPAGARVWLAARKVCPLDSCKQTIVNFSFVVLRREDDSDAATDEYGAEELEVEEDDEEEEEDYPQEEGEPAHAVIMWSSRNWQSSCSTADASNPGSHAIPQPLAVLQGRSDATCERMLPCQAEWISTSDCRLLVAGDFWEALRTQLKATSPAALEKQVAAQSEARLPSYKKTSTSVCFGFSTCVI